jgi:hypothetical protein
VFGPDDESDTRLSRTLTAGELALAAHNPVFAVSASSSSSNQAVIMLRDYFLIY